MSGVRPEDGPGGGSSAPTAVSVAMCTYNGQAFLAEQLGSILRQTVRPDELVVADDGSDDNTVRILESWAARFQESNVDLRVLAAPLARLGVTRNFERAVRACRGQVIVLADQDDLWRPDRVEGAMRELQRHPEILLYATDARLVDSDGKDMGQSLFQSLGLDDLARQKLSGSRAVESMLRRNYLPGMAMTFRAELISAAGPIPEAWAHDYWWAMSAALNDALLVSSDAPLMYRQHASNVLGAGQATLGGKARRLVSVRSDAKRRSVMFASLEDAVASWARDGQAHPHLSAVADKAAFEARRANLPAGRCARSLAVLLMLTAGSYKKHASNGHLNAVRDIMWPPESGEGTAGGPLSGQARLT